MSAHFSHCLRLLQKMRMEPPSSTHSATSGTMRSGSRPELSGTCPHCSRMSSSSLAGFPCPTDNNFIAVPCPTDSTSLQSPAPRDCNPWPLLTDHDFTCTKPSVSLASPARFA